VHEQRSSKGESVLDECQCQDQDSGKDVDGNLRDNPDPPSMFVQTMGPPVVDVKHQSDGPEKNDEGTDVEKVGLNPPGNTW